MVWWITLLLALGCVHGSVEELQTRPNRPNQGNRRKNPGTPATTSQSSSSDFAEAFRSLTPRERWQEFLRAIDPLEDGVISTSEFRGFLTKYPATHLSIDHLDREHLLTAAGLALEKHGMDLQAALARRPVSVIYWSSGLGSCQSQCGGFSPGPLRGRWCWCDSLCHQFGDCCDDKCLACPSSQCATPCPATADAAGGGCFPPRVCEYDRTCCCPDNTVDPNSITCTRPVAQRVMECAPRPLQWSELTGYAWTPQYSRQCTPDMCTTCPPRFGDCSAGPVTCETNLEQEPAHCGGCNVTCSDNAICRSGYCVLSCADDTADCNGDGSCSTDILSDVNNCGGCGHRCPDGAPNGPRARCVNGYCENSVYTTFTRAHKASVEERMDNFMAAAKITDTRRGETIAGMTRLGFHDCGTWLPSETNPNRRGGCHCCIFRQCPPTQNCEFTNPDNHGLEQIIQRLDREYRDFTHLMSRPDFFYCALNHALRISSGRCASGVPGCVDFVMPEVPFRWGRTMCLASPRPFFLHRLPSSLWGFQEMQDFYEARLGYDTPHWVALMGGGHSLGEASPKRSGHRGAWTETNDVVDNAYFKIMMNESNIWDRENPTPGFPGSPTKPQFEIHGTFHTGPMMLITDMSLGWCTKLNDGCPNVGFQCAVTHDQNGCPRRVAILEGMLADYANDQGLFYQRFVEALNHLEELTDDALHPVAP